MGCFPKFTGCFCLSLRSANLITSYFLLVCSAVALSQFAITGFRASLFYYVLYSILSLLIVTNSFSLYGIYKKKPSFLIPSLILSVGILLTTFSETMVLIICEFALDRKAPGYFGKDKLPYFIIIFVLTWLLASLEHSYYLKLEEDQKNRTGK